MKKTHNDMENLNTKLVQRIVKRFEESGSVEDRRHDNPGRPFFNKMLYTVIVQIME